jgi:hypothetical protein
MKNSILSLNVVLVLLLSLSPLASSAQKVKVEKIKGNKAVVVFSGATPEVGRTYNLEGRTSAASLKSQNLSRGNLIGFSASMSNQTVTSSSTSTSSIIALTGRYGWNLGKTEYGILGELANASYSSVTTSTFGGGGYFDYNFAPNVIGEAMVFGVGIQAKILSSNNGVKTYSSWAMFPAGFLKWFVLSPTTCLRIDGGFNYRNDMTEPKATTTTGLLVQGGFDFYF